MYSLVSPPDRMQLSRTPPKSPAEEQPAGSPSANAKGAPARRATATARPANRSFTAESAPCLLPPSFPCGEGGSVGELRDPLPDAWLGRWRTCDIALGQNSL